MEVDSSPAPETMMATPQEFILQRLENLGVPAENLEHRQPGLIVYVKNNKSQIEELVSALLPTNEEAMDSIIDMQTDSPKSTGSSAIKDLFHESMTWLQWLMFEGEPRRALDHLANIGQRGVCGAIWGNNDIAYRCRTCEHDPTCAICVPCFQNGNHKDHDYSVMYTGGGCCDCGDVTAWKREGFCSKHKGAEQIQPLPEECANSLGPVLDSLLSCWRKGLLFAESISEQSPRLNSQATEYKGITDALTSAVVEMLLGFCKDSESLLSFISRRVFSSEGLLDVLVRAERFLISGYIVRKLHELLLRMLGEPQFKYEFAKVFLSYYSTVVNDAVKEINDTVFQKYPLLSTFSVQIFTVPTLTPRLVKEMNLLAMLLDCLGDIFISCADENGRLKVNKWGNLYETTLRVVEDIRFVMSHSAVPRYVARDRRDILRTWMKLLTFVQGMNPQKRETGIHVEDEGENMHLPFVLGHTIANIHSLLVGGAFSISSNEDADDALFNTHIQDFEDQDSQRLAKVGRLSQESSVSSVAGRSPPEHASRTPESKSDGSPVPSSVLWLTFECLKAIENWLGVDNTSGPLLHILSPKTITSSGNNFFALKRTLSKFSRGGQIIRSHSPSDGIGLPSSTEGCNKRYSYSSPTGGVALNSGQDLAQETASFGGSDNNMLQIDYALELETLRVLSLSDWPDIAYKVSLQDTSVHIPLHRLLSMVLQRALRQWYGETALRGSCSNSSSAVDHDFFGHILGGCHPLGFSAFIMEHALRIKVFCAQVHAGMWRRNVDSAILSCEWYRSVRWSEQGLELDLFLLQCCAALGPSDQYVTRILERFELSDYLSLDLERSNEYEPTIVQEMLTLIIQIVKERRFSGLSPSECLERELVYKLSTGDATRSQLVKSLSRDLSKIDGLQEVLDRVAVYSNPSGINQGMYKLRTPYWKELDLYHPRWNSKELQVAEERYMQFCNVSALTSQLPKWTKIYPPLGGIAKIATCKTVLQIVRAIVFYAVFSDKSNASRAPDGVLLTALHLLSLALDICYMHRGSGDHSCFGDDDIPIVALANEELSLSKYGDQSLLSLLVLLMRKYRKENDFVEAGIFNLSSMIGSLLKKFAELQSGCKMKLQDLAPEVVNQLSQSVSTGDTKNMESVSDSDKRKAKARERQAAIMEKMRAQQSKFLKSIDFSAEAAPDDSKLGKERSDSDVRCNYEEATQVICSLCHDPNSKSPLSYLILLEKSRLLTFTNRGPPSWKRTQNSGKEPESSAQRMTNVSSRRSILSSSQEVISSPWLTQLIQNAINEFALEGQPKDVGAFFEYIRERFPALKIQLPCTSSNVNEETDFSLEMLEEQIYLLIRERMDVNSWHWDLSRNGKKISAGGGGGNVESLLLGKYISSLAGENFDSPAPESAHKTQLESRMPLTAYEGFGPSDCDRIYLSSCGHAVHQGCLDRYLSSLKERYIRRIVFEGGHIVDPDQGEFLCPVCRGLANSVLPTLPVDSGRFTSFHSSSSPSDAVGPSSSSSGVVDALHFQKALFFLQSAADVSGSREIFQRLPLRQFGRMRVNLESSYRVLCGMYFPDNDKISESGRLSHSLILYDTLKYSLISTEIATRSGKTSLAPNYSLGALYKELQSSNGFILALLLSIVQSTRTNNSLTVLLRLRGIQLFAESICTGTSANEISDPSVGGNMQDILECAETEDQYPDIQFWRWSADPVLAHDAFSSLMWIIYCLPCPVLSCEDAFLSLVHLFYAVTVTQAIITYCRKRQCSLLELGCNDSLVTDIYKVIEEQGVAHQYFESNFIETSYDIKDAIRSLTFPYLRRCALLWKLINSSRVVPFNDGTNILDGSAYSTNELMECGENNAAELIQIEKLEKILKIPSLDNVLNDVTIRLVVQKWLNHFYKHFETRGLKGALYSTPAAPFKLMLLPHLYQDLLQRYIKQNCPDCGAVQKDPALCLLCGKLCSASWKTCCRESGCQTHAMACGAVTGVFLLIRKTTVLLQRSARQAPWPSPYLDVFGEEDIDMHRGKPLYLNEERYAALTHMVASHGLDRSSKVLRQTTIGAFFML